MFTSWSVRVSKVRFLPLVLELFTSGITHIWRHFLLCFSGDLSSFIALELSGSIWPSRPGPAHDHQPPSPSAAAPAVSLPGQASGGCCPPHRPLRHLRLHRQRQLPVQWTCWPLRTGRGLPTQPAEDQQHGERLWAGFCEFTARRCTILHFGEALALLLWKLTEMLCHAEVCRRLYFVLVAICLRGEIGSTGFGVLFPPLLLLLSCALVCAAEAEGCSEDWILGHSFTYHYRGLSLWKP